MQHLCLKFLMLVCQKIAYIFLENGNFSARFGRGKPVLYAYGDNCFDGTFHEVSCPGKLTGGILGVGIVHEEFWGNQ